MSLGKTVKKPIRPHIFRASPRFRVRLTIVAHLRFARPTGARPHAHRRVCVYCGTAHPGFHRRGVQLLECPSCRGDLYARPPRSYAEMEGLTSSVPRPSRLLAGLRSAIALVLAAREFVRLLWCASRGLRASRARSFSVRRGAAIRPAAPRTRDRSRS